MSSNVDALNALVPYNLWPTTDLVPAGCCTVCLMASQSNHSRNKICVSNSPPVTLAGHKVFVLLKVYPPTSLLSGWLMSAFQILLHFMMNKLPAPGSGPDSTRCKLFVESTSSTQANHLRTFLDAAHTHSSLCTHREQVEQIRVGIDAGRRVLDLRQLSEDGVQLLGLCQVDPCLLFVGPVWQRHMHGYQVFQMHTEDRKSKAGAFREALAVLTVVPA